MNNQYFVAALMALAAGGAQAEPQWPNYGGVGGKQHSPLTQISPANVDELEVAWEIRTGDLGQGHVSQRKLTFEATPILWDQKLYTITGFNHVLAINAATGEVVWRYDAQLPKDISYDEVAARGVSLWHDDQASPQDSCSSRVFFGTLAGDVRAIDARTGLLCQAFGRSGRVDLAKLAGATEMGRYTITSPPAVVGDTVVFGSAIGDNRGVELEKGTVHALDARTGDIRWRWDPIPRNPNDPARSTWGGNSADRTGAGNVWAPMSSDPTQNLVYVPTTSPSPDFYGGERVGDNLYANSIVALDASTGSPRWHRQLIHHDVWDYDVASQPTLFELRRDGERIPAVVQATKTGMLFVMHRTTGEPLIPITEKPVPQGGVLGERLSPTQPFSGLPPLTSHDPVTEDDAYGVAFVDKRECAKAIRGYRSEGIFTPPSLQGSIQSPGYAGGMNWGGVSVDEDRQLIIANTLHLPMLVKLIPRKGIRARVDSGEFEGWDLSRQEGTPYVMARRSFMSSLDMPCVKPPWGTLAAVDLRRGEIAWQVPLGTIEDDAPAIVPNLRLGVPTIGGPISTASGLTFIAATTDYYLRAFRSETGEEVWRARLPTAGIATPMTYAIDGRQYVVIAAGGHGNMGVKVSDHLIAFALPK